ncbi:NFACT family protein [Candidatus Woesearchaeota archaeon]|nr:NFACT family protein [Candidatus Woesearchaeota archaeon]
MGLPVVKMKREFSVIELAGIVRELQLLVGGRIAKVFQHSDKLLSFECFKTLVGKKFVHVFRPGLVWVGVSKFSSLESGFFKSLKRLIEGGKIVSITQIGSERIIKIETFLGGKTIIIYVELFNKGQVVACNNDGKILALWETQQWKDRLMKIGEQYVLPQKLTNVFSMAESEFNSILTNIQENVSRTIATELGIGGVYAQELCLISGIDKNKNKLSVEELRVLFANLIFFFQRKIDARVVYENTAVKDVTSFPLKLYESLNQTSYKSYSDAVDAVFSNVFSEEDAVVEVSEQEKRKKKFLNIIETQKVYFSVLEKQAVAEQRKGELIYENYQKLKDILTTAQKIPLKELKTKARELNIKDVDEAKGEFVVEV